MATEVLLPRQGNSVESCIILEWKKREGDSVSEGETIAEVETDKATFDVESTAAGVILRLLAQEGDDVPVLTPIALVGSAGESASAPSAEAPGTDAPAADAPSANAPAAGRQVAAGQTGEPRTEAAAPTAGERVRISPRARKLAEKLGLPVDGVAGSGPGGRILVRDIEAAAQEAPERRSAAAATEERVESKPAVPPAAGSDGAEEVPVRGVRKLIADRMRASLSTTAQLTMDASADARALLRYRKRLKSSGEPRFNAVTINDLCLFAAARALSGTPEMNATFQEGVIRRFHDVHLGFAVDTDRGLMVPVIRNAAGRSLLALAEEAHRLTQACVDGNISPDELSGGTFTVTNLGAYGIERFTPVLNAPQVGILGVCSITQRAIPAEEEHVPMIGLSLTVDHQVIDGAPAARFLQRVSGIIAEIDLWIAG